MQQETKSTPEFIPHFRAAFLSPRYWGVWLGIALMAAMAFLPLRLRDWMIGAVGRLAGRLASGARRRAQINLMLCFPQMAARRREAIIDTMFARAGQSMFLMAELTLRGPQRLLRHTHWHGGEIIEQAREQGIT